MEMLFIEIILVNISINESLRIFSERSFGVAKNVWILNECTADTDMYG